ncbi:MAG: hypothetical protein IH978_07465 [Nitrospinae bacterium]|nr:hypothetical protein [Nitrospinota bacterium]
MKNLRSDPHDLEKSLYKIKDLPEDSQQEILQVIEIFKSQKDGLIAEMDTRLADSGQGMLFIKWI